MSTPSDQDPPDLRYAEYVLGVLDREGQAEVEREIETSESAAAAVSLWARRLLPLAEELVVELPSAQVWTRIQRELQIEGAASPPQGAGVWENLRFWHRWSLASAILLAAACAAIVFLIVQRPVAPPIPYMASAITGTDGRVDWTATMDLENASMIIVPASPQGVSAGRSPELWLIPHGGKPIPVGILSATVPITIKLSPALLARLGPTATLIVSVEPLGGSPTGELTGTVIASGKIGAAAAATASPSGSATAMVLSTARLPTV